MTSIGAGRGQSAKSVVIRAGVSAWITCLERREEGAFARLMGHVAGCDRCTAAAALGRLLDAAELCGVGARLIAAWDAAEDALAATLLPEAVPA